MIAPLGPDVLPADVRARFIDGVNGLRMHLLEVGSPDKPCVLLLHGFPEMAYSWRKVMPELAEAGYYVVAPDQRGFGRTTGWDPAYDGDLASFGVLNLVRDIIGLAGGAGAAACGGGGWARFRRRGCGVVRVAAAGPVSPGGADERAVCRFARHCVGPAKRRPSGAGDSWTGHASIISGIIRRVRRTPTWRHCPQGLHAFLRAYYHHKSADWAGNQPFRLEAFDGSRTCQDADLLHHGPGSDMAETVAQEMPGPEADRWLPMAAGHELRVYSSGLCG